MNKHEMMADLIRMAQKATEAKMTILCIVTEVGEKKGVQTVSMIFDTDDNRQCEKNGIGRVMQEVTENLVRALNTMLDDTEMEVVVRHRTTGEIMPQPDRFDMKIYQYEIHKEDKPS